MPGFQDNKYVLHRMAALISSEFSLTENLGGKASMYKERDARDWCISLLLPLDGHGCICCPTSDFGMREG
jgi:hypothetical protein